MSGFGRKQEQKLEIYMAVKFDISRPVFLAVVFFFVIAATAARSDDRPHRQAVTCVQNQVAALGEDPGPVDGLWGHRTRAAVAELRTRPQFAGLPVPRRGDAVVICRMLADLDPSLIRHTPSAHRPLDIAYGDKVHPLIKENLTARIEDTYRSLRRHIGIRMPLRIHVFASNDIEELAEAIRHSMGSGFPRKLARESAVRRCEGEEIAGFMVPELIVICGQAFASRRTNTNFPWSKSGFLIVHEILHHFQYQMSGAAGVLPNGQSRIPGPLWLTEGIAVAATEAFVERQSADEVAAFLSDRTNADLGDLAEFIEADETSGEAYATYGLAVAMMMTGRDIKAALNYYSERAEGVSHQDAFERTFGVSEAVLLDMAR